MSTHTIHGVKVSITIAQGAYMTEISRGRCIGRVVNICRAMPAEEFLGAVADMRSHVWGGPNSAALLAKLDAALAEHYRPIRAGDYPPIADLELED